MIFAGHTHTPDDFPQRKAQNANQYSSIPLLHYTLIVSPLQQSTSERPMKNTPVSNEINAVVPTPEVSTNVVYRCIVTLYRTGKPVTQALIVKTTGLSRATVSRHVGKLMQLNRINVERAGRATFLQPKEA